MSEMVERVAQSIAQENRAPDWDFIDEYDVGDRGYLFRDDYRNLARAAIKAMREPTKAMVTEAMIQPYPTVQEAGGLLEQGEAAVRIEWQAMIDEALK